LRARDPLGSGFDKSTDMLLHLIWKLLAWDPSDRLSPLEAMSHPYFTSTESGTERDVPSDMSILNSVFAHQTPFSGFHNALELQLLEPVDLDASPVSSFTCPKCGKNYTDFNSCYQHARSRKHARFCTYDRSTLPPCIVSSYSFNSFLWLLARAAYVKVSKECSYNAPNARELWLL
jgi:serine/threonine protein kinase